MNFWSMLHAWSYIADLQLSLKQPTAKQLWKLLKSLKE